MCSQPMELVCLNSVEKKFIINKKKCKINMYPPLYIFHSLLYA